MYYDYEDFYYYQEPSHISKINKLWPLRHNINLAGNITNFIYSCVFDIDNSLSKTTDIKHIKEKILYILYKMYDSDVHWSYDITEISKNLVEIADILKKEIKIKEEIVTKMKNKKVKVNWKKVKKLVEVKQVKKTYYLNITADEFLKKKEVKELLDNINKEWLKIVEQDTQFKKEKEERQKRYEEKIKKLKELRKTALWVWTRKIKLRLNKLAKQWDNIAKLLRLLLELEDINIRAKQTDKYYQDKVYNMKDWHIKEVITFLRQINYDKDYWFKKDTELDDKAMVFYCDLPWTGEQVSWHTYNGNNIIPEEYLKIEYKKDWTWETEETTYEIILRSIEKLYLDYLKS